MGRSNEVAPSGQAAGLVNGQENGRSVSAQVLMIPFPSQPHILPLLDLAHQLVSCEGITVTVVLYQVLIDRLPKEEAEKGSKNDAVHFVAIPDDRPGFDPPKEFAGTRPDAIRENLQLAYNLEPFVDKLLQDRRENSSFQGPTCLVVDSMIWWKNDLASRLSIPRYVVGVNPASYLLKNVQRRHDQNRSVQLEEDIAALNCDDLRRCLRNTGEDSIVSRTIIKMRFLHSWWPQSVMESDGVLLNTCVAIESEAINSLRTLLPEKMPLFPVGPLGMSQALNVSMEGLQLSDEVGVKKWLDQQPQSSVLFVSFGTTGMLNLTKQHVAELARGLEASQQRFVWVLRAPPGVDDIADLLPPGFEEGVEGRGLLLRGWAPQLQILSHPSTGGFLSSCGWNSTIESLSRGVPIIGWPSYADQPIICRYVEEVLNVAISLPQQAKFFVAAEEIEKAVRILLESDEGRAMRGRAEKYKTSITAEVASRRTVQEFANLIGHRPSGLPPPTIKVQWSTSSVICTSYQSIQLTTSSCMAL